MVESKKATVIGDTSQFHLGSKTNYKEFRKLVRTKYEIIGEIPYNAFSLDFQEYAEFYNQLSSSRWWDMVEASDCLVVHGEGLTERCEPYTFPFIYFSKVARQLGSQSQLVNFSMYDVAPFREYLKLFDYIACREVVTQEKLKEEGIDAVLSFDCSLLSRNAPAEANEANHIAAMRGRNAFETSSFERRDGSVRRYNCCWKWDESGITLDNLEKYIHEISKSEFVLSTSFHGNIFSFLSGVPFVILDEQNPKYRALEKELYPERTSFHKSRLPTRAEANSINDYFKEIFPALVRRARRNIC